MNDDKPAFWYSFSREKTDEQYNPTLWTMRMEADQLLPAHIEFTGERSEHYRKRMGPLMQTVQYGEGEFAGDMDIFRPADLAEDAPIVIYIHGGWWQWFSKEQFSFLAEPFNRHGFAVYMPGYRMAQEWANDRPMESIVEQMERATAFVLEEASKRNSHSVYLVGHSAGGQLVAMLHKTDWSKYDVAPIVRNRIKGVFSIAGLFDIRPLVDSFVNDEINMSMQSAEKVSPLLTSSPSEPARCPLHLVVPEFDTPEFFRQTKEYQHALLKAGEICYLRVTSNRDHLDVIENLVHENDEVMGYLLDHMRA